MIKVIKKVLILVGVFSGFCLQAQAQSEKGQTSPPREIFSLVWETEKLSNPESVVYDPNAEVLYVSEKALGESMGAGHISRLDTQGRILEERWVDGLKAPKGLQILGPKLYVADVTDLVEIDRETGKILAHHSAEGIKYLNDVTVDRDGNIYVSDMQTSAIYRLDKNGNFSLWLKTPELENPNGLYGMGDSLYVAAWGPVEGDDFLHAAKGRVLKVGLRDKKITKITREPLGNLDGIQPVGDESFYISDWKTGQIFHVLRETGVVVEKLDLARITNRESARGVGDIAFVPQTGGLYLPMTDTVIMLKPE